MKSDSFIRVLAGVVVIASAALAHFVSEWWLLLTVLAGLNLIQSAFTGFCPPEILARKLGWVHNDSCKEKSSSKDSCSCFMGR